MQILMFLHDRGEVRHSEFTEIITSRGTLSNNLNDLEEEQLIVRRVVTTKPAQSFYSLSEKGKNIAAKLVEVIVFLV